MHASNASRNHPHQNRHDILVVLYPQICVGYISRTHIFLDVLMVIYHIPIVVGCFHRCPKFPLVGWWKKRGLFTNPFNNRSMMINGMPASGTSIFTKRTWLIASFHKPHLGFLAGHDLWAARLGGFMLDFSWLILADRASSWVLYNI